ASRVFNTTSVPGNGTLIFIPYLSFTGGKATGNYGGAIVGSTQFIDLNNCVLTGNTADDGGAVGMTGSGTVQLIDCTVSNNSALIGGAIFANAADARTIIIESTLSGNTANFFGGGVYTNYLSLVDSTLSANHALGGGGG